MKKQLTHQEIANFPSDNPKARLTRHGRHLYVTESYVRAFNAKGAKLCSYRIIGKVVDNRYYPIEEYRRLFKRNGEPRIPVPKKPNRSYVRCKPLSEICRKAPHYSDRIPDASSIKNFPHDTDGARIIRIKKALYVVTTRYYRENGSARHQYTYLGRIIDGEFFTTEQYRRLFKRSGERRDTESE